MINGLDMNICTETPKLNMCMACKKVSETNHYIVAEKTIITLCTDCLEQLCIKGIERCGYRKINNIFNRRKITYGKKIQ